MTKPNMPILLSALGYIQAHPEEHQQQTFSPWCGSARCLLGWCAAMLVATEGREKVDMAGSLAVLLGLSYKEWRELYWPGNTLQDLEQKIAEIGERA
jgi:hypothetical protein